MSLGAGRFDYANGVGALAERLVCIFQGDNGGEDAGGAGKGCRAGMRV